MSGSSKVSVGFSASSVLFAISVGLMLMVLVTFDTSSAPPQTMTFSSANNTSAPAGAAFDADYFFASEASTQRADPAIPLAELLASPLDRPASRWL
jgi:hypothetical protein